MDLDAWTGDARALAERIAAFVSTDGGSEPFDGLALAIDRWQRRHDPLLAALAEREPTTWWEVPAVPVSLHKDLPIGTAPRDAPVVFRTSGTTGGGRGAHRLRSAALYDLGAVRHHRACVPDAPTDVVALLADPAALPDASLSHMVALFGRCSWHFTNRVERADIAARVAAARGPLYVAATAFALAEWLDGPAPRLPEGSVLMVTGGFKGRIHRLDGPALLAETRSRLAPARLVTEYGMTELSSQLWGTPETAFRPPAWLRALAVDPESGAPLPAGDTGQLRFVDLCNLDGPLAIETMDQGRVDPDGGVWLDGRLPGAPARGCSLTVEETWGRR